MQIPERPTDQLVSAQVPCLLACKLDQLAYLPLLTAIHAMLAA